MQIYKRYTRAQISAGSGFTSKICNVLLAKIDFVSVNIDLIMTIFKEHFYKDSVGVDQCFYLNSITCIPEVSTCDIFLEGVSTCKNLQSKVIRLKVLIGGVDSNEEDCDDCASTLWHAEHLFCFNHNTGKSVFYFKVVNY